MSDPPRRPLRLAALRDLPADERPRIDPASLPIRIVHLGPGAFHRAHQAIFTEDAIASAGGGWGICGVTQTSPRVRDELTPQDGLYSVTARDGESSQRRVVGVLRELLWAAQDQERLVARLADPVVAVVSLTVTEPGYRRAATGSLDLDDAAVTGDLADGGTRTVHGQLVAGLGRRRQAGIGPLSVISCDNLTGNGAILRELVLEFAARRGDDNLTDWIAEQVAFPATMVDRIVPAPTAAGRADAERALGLTDAGALLTEPFAQWVIEDRFAAERPAWERAGAILTDDVAPYEQVKLRMLNGTHSLLAHLGALAGLELIAEVLDPRRPFADAAGAFWTADVVPTLTAPAGIDLAAYGAQVLARFANPWLPYRVLQVAGGASQKLGPRLLGTAADRRAAGAEPRWTALAVAAWLRLVSVRHDDDGRELTVTDPLEDVIAAALEGASGPAAVVDRLLSQRAIFPPELAADRVWRELLVEALSHLQADGALGAVRALLGD